MDGWPQFSHNASTVVTYFSAFPITFVRLRTWQCRWHLLANV